MRIKKAKIFIAPFVESVDKKNAKIQEIQEKCHHDIHFMLTCTSCKAILLTHTGILWHKNPEKLLQNIIEMHDEHYHPKNIVNIII